MRKVLGIAFLLAQLVSIAHARFTESRYFCWAPYDTKVEYVLDVTLGRQKLTPKEISKRYRIPSPGVDRRSVQHVKHIISQYERTYGQKDHARITLSYKTNGVPQKEWHWPPEPE
jgi:hypothetical protein